MEPEQHISRRKQGILILLCCLTYGFAYAGRYSYNANIAPIMDFYGVTRADAGLVGTFFFFAYGVGQLLNALFCKYYNKKYIIPGALLISAGINVVLFFCPPFWSIKFLWLINGICQSVLWPVLIQTLGETLDEVMMKRAVLGMSSSILLGTFLAYGGGALFNLGNFFRASFLFGMALMLTIGVIWFLLYDFLMRKTSVAEKDTAEAKEPSKRTSAKAVAWAFVGLLAVCAIFAVVDNFIKDGFNTWTPVILREQFGFGDSISMVLTLVLPIFGVFGSAIALTTNRWIRDFRLLMGFFYLLMGVCIGGLMFSMRQDIVILFLICQGLISCLAHGINAVLTSIMPLVLRDKMNSGSLAGYMNASCYIGSTASAYGLGKIADGAGWNTAILILLITAVGAAALAGVVAIIGFFHKKHIERKEVST